MHVHVELEHIEVHLELELELERSWSWSCKLIISNPHAFNPILQFRNQALWRSRVINETLDDIVIVISYFFQIPLELNNFIYQIFPQIIWVCWF